MTCCEQAENMGLKEKLHVHSNSGKECYNCMKMGSVITVTTVAYVCNKSQVNSTMYY